MSKDSNDALVGAIVLSEAQGNPTFRAQIERLVRERLGDDEARRVLGLGPADGDHLHTGD